MTTSYPTQDAAKSYLATVDFTYIINFMCHERYPLPRWTESDAKHCASLYKNYLWLAKIHPDAPLVPTKHIDEFWHNHILYTREYHRDCRHILVITCITSLHL